MDPERLDDYFRAVTVIEAREALVQMDIVSFPMMKEEDRRQLHQRYNKMAYPKSEVRESIAMEEFARRLRAEVGDHGQ